MTIKLHNPRDGCYALLTLYFEIDPEDIGTPEFNEKVSRNIRAIINIANNRIITIHRGTFPVMHIRIITVHIDYSARFTIVSESGGNASYEQNILNNHVLQYQ